MRIINLYRYVRPDGGMTVSPVEPDCEYTPMFRIVADESKELTKDGVERTTCTDVESTDGWYEIDALDER